MQVILRAAWLSPWKLYDELIVNGKDECESGALLFQLNLITKRTYI